ncbi:ALPHA-CRYSTALLIN DOMAIN 31.2, alpha-crystallin domain 32.1 [Hibiscus trionum]|uniref:ALPHA-CRYSTALLIN DOMAIN 31.2, alpha-crystallin domain 32.1 n=1 Tax=Hibiscus trionum TaxID=183268 RepID=A0A9W7IQ71_HIBTR|nr:ALPHA-CRYSTALLIN DOMAIN 31.2, alpha-crystallin domain 32.1 [Hibiscus trionum]
MENEAARRRISNIAGHFSPNDDILSVAHLFPMNCSGSLNCVIRRRDNRIYFARQGSAYQACFMRQVSRAERTAPQSAAPSKSSCTPSESSNASEAPLFSRPEMMDPNFSILAATQPLGLDWRLSVPDPPMFARPNKSTSEETPLQSKKKTCCSRSNGTEWSPRMDVAESRRDYVMMVEIPGVTVGDIRVEVDDHKLTVTGERSSHCWKVAADCSKDSISAYHKREISQGPYQVVWPLPANADRDSVSAELLDGILRIVIPKL